MAANAMVEQIRCLIQPILEEIGLDLLELRFIPHTRRSQLQVTIDREAAPVTLEDCETASRQISRILDVEDPIDGAYSLEISSPGFKRLIRIPKDLHRFVGHPVKLRLHEPINKQVVIRGVLTGEGDPLELDSGDFGALKIPLDQIRQANLDE